MNSKKALRLLVVAIFVTLAAGYWLKKSSPDVEKGNVSTPKVNSAATDFDPPTVQSTPVRPWEASPKSRITRPPTFKPKSAPQTLFVEWHGSWYPAEILSAAGSSNLIRYTGYGAEWDEWIMAERMRYAPADQPPQRTVSPGVITEAVVVRSDSARTTIARGDLVVPLELQEQIDSVQRPPVQGSPAKGDLLVQWGSHWWPAEILKSEGDKHFIRYTGYGPEWDEWVTLERMGLYEGDDAQP